MRNTTIQIRIKTSKLITNDFIDDITDAIEKHHGDGTIESFDWHEKGTPPSKNHKDLERRLKSQPTDDIETID